MSGFPTSPGASALPYWLSLGLTRETALGESRPVHHVDLTAKNRCDQARVLRGIELEVGGLGRPAESGRDHAVEDPYGIDVQGVGLTGQDAGKPQTHGDEAGE